MKETFSRTVASYSTDPGIDSPEDISNGFNSEKLNHLLASSELGAIYIWSPHMILSVMGIPVVEELCRDLKVPLTIIMDPAARPIITGDVKDTFAIKDEYFVTNEAFALSLLGSELHYPNLILYRDGKLLSGVLFGAKSITTYKNYITQKLKLSV